MPSPLHDHGCTCEACDIGAGKIIAAQRQRTDETIFTLQINEAQCADLASGFVPRTVKAACIDLLDYLDQDERRARRPLERKKRTKGHHADAETTDPTRS